MKISVSMIALNEEKNIERALSSCGFADEIVVVDGGSTDRTIDILKAHAKVVLIEHAWENNFGRQRQISLEHCTGDWVIRLDTDEAFSMEFEKNIKALLSSTSADVVGYKIRQCNLVGDEKYYSRIFDNYENIPRIWRNAAGIRWEGHIHEILAGLSKKGQVKLWDVYVVHYGFLDKQRYWQKGEHYSKIPGSGFNEPDRLYYREYDIQPRPEKAAVGPQVPPYRSEEYSDGLSKVAILLRPDVTYQELKNYELLSDNFDITCYSTSAPAPDGTHLKLHIIKLPAGGGNPDFMEGLEFELFDKDIIITTDIARVFTSQAVAVKIKFGKKIIALIRENAPDMQKVSDDIGQLIKLNMKYTDVFAAGSETIKDSLMLTGTLEEDIVITENTHEGLTSLVEEIFRSTFKSAVAELAEYTHMTGKDVCKRIRSIYQQQVREWRDIVGDKLTNDKVDGFYRDTDSYLFDLVQYNYENTYYLQWSGKIFRFCAELNKAKGGLKIMDFGGGIGSQLIALSGLKGAELTYADIPGKTFDYAKWRFSSRQIEISLIDASKNDFLKDKLYDVVITLDVLEHLVSPEAAIEYLIEHINPDGYLLVVTSFTEKNRDAGWHLNVDRYTDEAFYNLIKATGMEMINDGYPKIFQKNEELVTLITAINAAVRKGRFADARKNMEAYLSLRMLDLDMLVKYADVCLMLGDRDTALESLEKVRLFNPEMPEALKIAEKIRRKDNETAPCK